MAWGRPAICLLLLLAPLFLRPASGSDPSPSTIEPALWSLKKLVRPAIASHEATASQANPIDAFISARLAERGLASAPAADKRTLIRRAYFDLTGLPPAPERVEQFVADAAEDAFERLIDELLASPEYGERWARHWLDLARYADSGGYETDIYFRHAWRYRDYVVKSFNDDKPYDQFVQEQIAGDEIWPDNLDLDGNYVMAPEKLRHLEARIGTGLYALGPQIHESNMDARKLEYERLSDWTDTTGSVFLGLTIGCARCHDHKFDPITQRDYFALQAVFAGSREVEVPLINAMEIADFKQHYPRILAVDEARKAYRLFEKRVSGRERTPEEKDRARQLLEAIGRAVLDVPDAASSSPNDRWDGLLEIPAASVLGHERPELVASVHLLQRGDVRRPNEQMAARLPQALAAATGTKPELPGPFGGRKQLALWLTRPDHPLTARVMVNRVWQWHFGQGLVSTPNDFGNMGQPPSHPALLDWLACEFVEPTLSTAGKTTRQGEGETRREGVEGASNSALRTPHSALPWSIKRMHKLIMLSQAYRRDGRFATEKHLREDPENRLFWRMNRRRLEAEALWDALHAAAGTLNLKLGGRSVIPPVADDEIAALRDRWHWPVSADPAEHNRRGLYILVRRNFRFPMFEVFDAPVNSVSCPARDVTTVAPQALWFLNNKVMLRQAQELAGRVVREAGDAPAEFVKRAWMLALSRPPTAGEEQEALKLIDSLAADSSTPALENLPEALAKLPSLKAAALAKFCLALFNLNEFAFVD
jgi:hypothetical protein